MNTSHIVESVRHAPHGRSGFVSAVAQRRMRLSIAAFSAVFLAAGCGPADKAGERPSQDPSPPVVPVPLPEEAPFNYPSPPREGRPDMFTIAEDGVARCVIVYPAVSEHHRALRWRMPTTANGLAHYLERVTGARFAVQTDDEDVPAGMGAIHVGETRVAARSALELPELRYGDVQLPNLHGFEIRTLDPQTLVIRGPTLQAVQFGVVGFLERYAGVRQYWLDRIGEVIPNRPTLRVPELEWQDWPFFVSRGLPVFGRADLSFFRQYAMPHSHSYYRLLPSAVYGVSNPEYYPLISGERKVPAPGLGSTWQPCVSNPGVARVMADAVIEHFRNHPRDMAMNVSVNDGRGDCECADCRAMDAPDVDYSIVRGMDRYVKFTNRVAELVTEEFPDKLITYLAYQATRDPPETVQPHPNTVPVMWLNHLAAWLEKDLQHLGVFQHHHYRRLFLPKVNPRQEARRIRYLAGLGLGRTYDYYGNTLRPVTGVAAYVACRLMWDPREDVDGLLRDYHDGLFGPAGTEMRAYHEAMEGGYERWLEEVGTPHPYGKDMGSSHGRAADSQFRVLNLEEAERAHEALERAAETPGLSTEEAERIALIRARFGLQELGVRRYWAGERLKRPVESVSDAVRAVVAAHEVHTTTDAMREYIETVLESPPMDRWQLFRDMTPGGDVSYAALKEGRLTSNLMHAVSSGLAEAADALRERLGPEAAAAWWDEQLAHESHPKVAAALIAARHRSTGIELENLVPDPGFEQVGARLAPDRDDPEVAHGQVGLHVWHGDRTPWRVGLSSSETRTGDYAVMIEHAYMARLTKRARDTDSGARYRAGLWIRHNDQPGQYRVSINAHLPPDNAPKQLVSIPVPRAPDEWQEVMADVIAPPETRYLSVRLFVNSQARDARCWVDDVFVGRYPEE